MVRIGTVWDSALDAVRGRAGVLTPIAAGALLLPGVIQAGIRSFFGPMAAAGVAGAGTSLILALASIATLLLTLWGALAITGVASHPDATRGEAGRQATARLLPLLGVYLVIGLAMVALFIPLGVLLAASGATPQAITSPGFRPDLSGGLGMALGLYALVLLGLLCWTFARLLPLVPVVLHERLGLGAIGRAFALTSGLGGKLVGLFILYVVVVGVASFAATAVLGSVLRLILGADGSGAAAFMGGVAGAVVSTVLSVLFYVFIARLYAGLLGRDARPILGDDPAR